MGSKMKKRIEFIKIYIKVIKQYKKFQKEHKDFFVLAGTPLHGNLGDHAIVLAERKMLKDIDENKEILEIPLHALLWHANFFKFIIKSKDILVQGGGSLGTLWMNLENMVRRLIEVYPNNKIVVLPQTVYFEKNKMEEFEKSKQMYTKHKQFYICAREKDSYDLSCEMIGEEKVILMPDMVPYLKYDMKHIKTKQGAILCFRHDKEKTISDEMDKKVYECLQKYYQNDIKYTDTVQEYGISETMREEEVKKKIEEFAKVKLVVTDRLHGMVFSALAGTPCIALANCNYKIKGVYEWIKHNNYVRFLEDMSQFEETVEELYQMSNCEYNNEVLMVEYQKIEKIIL